ncbi:MAG: hypothetical protein IVW36_03280 [Dehalococcoidia bacterium]|nr:hypothetical protein [Dehalococcoidia bacterium]
MRAADVSNWSGTITAEQASCLKRAGIELLICGTQEPEITRRQIAAAEAAGLRTEAYVILRWPRSSGEWPVAAQVRAGRGTIAGTPVRRLWIDCEQYLSVPQPPPATTVAMIAEAVAACAGIACGIYTARAWWRRSTGDARDFAALPLWDARYVRREGDPIPPFVPYGGWSRATMTQWHDTTRLCGVSLDFDEREEEDGLSTTEYEALQAELSELRSGIGALLRQEGVLGARSDALGREVRQILALIADGRTPEAAQRLRFQMTAAGEAWPPVASGATGG